MKNASRRCIAKGFTLIEILVVLTIISVLAAILLGVFFRVRENGRRTVCLSNLHQISLGLQQYVQDNDSRFPAGDDPDIVLLSYIKDKTIFKCPSAPQPFGLSYVIPLELWNTRKISNGRHESVVPDAVRIISVLELVGEDEPHIEASASCMSSEQVGVRHFNGNNYAFVDGHVKWLSAQQAGEWFCKTSQTIQTSINEEVK